MVTINFSFFPQTLILYEYVCHSMQSPDGPEESVGTLVLKLQGAVNHPVWVLATDPSFSAKPIRAPNKGTTYPAPCLHTLKNRLMSDMVLYIFNFNTQETEVFGSLRIQV